MGRGSGQRGYSGGLVVLLGARVGPADEASNLTWAPSWAGMDVTKQVNMEPPPQCQLSQSGFSHYLSLSPRERGEGREGILLPDAQGMEMAGLGDSGTAEGPGEQPTGPSAPAGSEPFVGAADWDPARVDSALSWPKVQGGWVRVGGWWWGEASASRGLSLTSKPSPSVPQPKQGGVFPGRCKTPFQPAVPQGKSRASQRGWSLERR